MSTIRAAGIMFKTKKDHSVLFVKRSDDSDYPGYWCFPGGKVEEGESLEECARREALEEIGPHPEGEMAILTRKITNPEVMVPTVAGPADAAAVEPPLAVAAPVPSVDFTTFIQVVDETFTPVLDHEHSGYAWAPASSAPEPLHPGCAVALARLTMDELGIARAMVRGDLEGSQRYINMTMFNMRITGTGMAYRRGIDEHVFRRPELFLNEDFLARCNGLSVIVQHPKGKTLNSQEFADRVVGNVFLPYIRGNEVWAIVKIYDDTTIQMLETNQLSTSPAVVFRDPKTDNIKLSMDDGSALLIEGKPALLDHLAICHKGVWDKGGEPRGIIFETREDDDMTEEERRLAAAKAQAEKDAKLKADAEAEEEKKKADDGDAGVLLDKLLGAVDGLSKRMDSWDEEKKAKADAEAKEKADADEKEKAEKEKADNDGKSEDEKKAKEKADADEKEKQEAKARDDAAKADAEETRKQIQALADAMPKDLSDVDHAAMADAQARADAVLQLEGKSAPRPLQGETPMRYRRRLITPLKAHSKHWKDVDLSAIADEAAFANIEDAIYADAEAAGRNPVNLPEGELREHVTQDVTGRRISSFNGQPKAWMSTFTGHRRRMTGIRNAS